MTGRRCRQGGFTLIEILIALIVLVVGIVGIVSVFPVGIIFTAEATGDTVAANLAESVYASLVAAHRQVIIPPVAPGGGVSNPRVILIHDLAPCNSGTDRYEFELPPTPLAPNTCPSPAQQELYPYCHPDPARPGMNRSECFSLGNDPWLQETSRDIRATSDPSDLYWGYGFKFYVRKVPTIPVGGNSGLYEYNIVIYRLPPAKVGPCTQTRANDKPLYWATGLKPPPPEDPNKYVIAVMSARISGP